MAIWSVKPKQSKSIIERVYLKKSDQTIVIETCWSSGEFTVETEDENPPNIEAGVDIYNCDYPYELIETLDSWHEGVDMEKCNEETKKWLKEFLEDNSWIDLENQGWYQSDCEMIIENDLLIERC